MAGRSALTTGLTHWTPASTGQWRCGAAPKRASLLGSGTWRRRATEAPLRRQCLLPERAGPPPTRTPNVDRQRAQGPSRPAVLYVLGPRGTKGEAGGKASVTGQRQRHDTEAERAATRALSRSSWLLIGPGMGHQPHR